MTFAFNDGPGSSSVWPHLGLLGPRRVLRGEAGALLPPPYALAEDVIAHLRIPAGRRANIEHRHYEAGHMVYVHEPSRRRQSKDLADFVTRSSPPSPS